MNSTTTNPAESRKAVYLTRYISDDLVQLWTFDGGLQLWSRGRINKTCRCHITGLEIIDRKAWRPITNGKNRSRRISEAAIKKLRNP